MQISEGSFTNTGHEQDAPLSRIGKLYGKQSSTDVLTYPAVTEGGSRQFSFASKAACALAALMKVKTRYSQALSILLLASIAPFPSEAEAPSRPEALSRPFVDGPEGKSGAHSRLQSSDLQVTSDEHQKLWVLAQKHLRDGSPRAALPYLEKMVTDLPGEAWLRLELAYALFRTGDDHRARYHFEQALGGDITEKEKAAAERVLSQIEKRRSWQASFQFAVVPETNPLLRPKGDTITIGGLDFRLDRDSQASPGTGLEVGGGLTWTPSLGGNVKARLSFAAFSKLYSESQFNEIVLRTASGLLRSSGRGGSIGGGFLLEQRRLADKALHQGPGVYLSYDQRLTPRTKLSFHAEYKSLDYSTAPHRDGSSASTNLRLSHAMTSQLAMRGSIFARRVEAESDFDRFTELGLSLGAYYSFENGIIADFQLFRGVSDRDGTSPLFRVVRSDDSWGADVRVRSRNLTLGKFVPTFGLSYERQRSTVGLYDYETMGASVGLSRDF